MNLGFIFLWLVSLFFIVIALFYGWYLRAQRKAGLHYYQDTMAILIMSLHVVGTFLNAIVVYHIAQLFIEHKTTFSNGTLLLPGLSLSLMAWFLAKRNIEKRIRYEKA